jgi:hypothetical protein
VTTRALCQTRPAEYWDTDNDGARLALGLCSVCPSRRGDTCDAGLSDPRPHGVIRAGVAYSDTGHRLPICRCGYPQTNYLGGAVSDCPRCKTPDVPIPNPKLVLRWRVRDLFLAGYTDDRIAPIVGRHPSTIRAIRSREGWARTRAETHAARSRTDREAA